ncbi:MAG: hypothetical protein PHR28_14250 [candidate division Zixibacteria bacterium]|nr:hypothetical protein [candidate division Zixibacteria bacterium]
MLAKSLISVAVIVIIAGTAWYLFAQNSPTDIGKILENPWEYAEKDLTISGTVKQAVSVLVAQYFIVDDGSGEIPVITDKVLPKVGARVKVHGKIDTAFELLGVRLIVFIEEK